MNGPRETETPVAQFVGAASLIVAGVWLLTLGLTGGSTSLTWAAIQVVIGAVALIIGASKMSRYFRGRAADRARPWD